MTKKLHLFLLCAFALLFGSVSAQKVVTFDAKSGNTDASTFTKEGVTLSLDQNTSSTPGGGYLNEQYDQMRIYKGAILNVTSTEGNIEKVVFTCTASNTANYGPGNFTVSEGTYTYSGTEGTWVGSAATVAFNASKAQVRATKIEVTLAPAGENYVAAPTIKGKANFLETVEVALTAGEGAEVRYTLDGTTPDANSTLYTAPITLTETTTVKAVAIEGGNLSEVSEATFTKVVPEELAFADLCNLTADKKQVKVNFNGVVVAFVDGGTVHLREGENAAALYNIGLDLQQGQVLEGYIVADFKLYNSMPELVVNNDLTDVSTISLNPKPAEVTPYVVSVAALNEGKWLGHYVQLCDVTIETETVDSKTTTYIVQGEDKIACYKGIDLTAFVGTGKTYDVDVLFNSIYKGTPQVKPLFIEEVVSAATVEAIDPACGHYDVMPNTLKLTFSSEVSTLEFGLLRTDRTPGRGYYLEDKDYTINGKEMVLNLPAEYVTNASIMNIILSVVDANNQYVTYAYDAEYLDEGYITLAYTAPVRADIFTMTTSDPAAGEVEKLDVINVTFGEGNTYVGGFDTNKEVVVLNDDGNVVTKAKMAVVEEEFEENGETYTFPTSTVQFTLETPVTAAGEYTFVIPDATVFNEGYNSESEGFGIEYGAIYNPEIRINYTVVAPAVEEEYTVNFEKDSAVRHASRRLSAVKLTAGAGETQTIAIANSSLVYNDMTQGEVFVCEAGETLKAEFVYDGSWMHGYVYIDMDADKQFSFDANANDQTGKDLVSYSFYGVDNEDSGYNSAGMHITGDARSTLECPEFKAPTVPGEYRMRYKVDWNSVDAGGCVDPNNHIINNGGTITDVILKVVEVSGIDTVTTKTTDKVYTIDGRLVNAKAGEKLAKGLYIVGGKKIYVK